jgi:hypothetical protein
MNDFNQLAVVLNYFRRIINFDHGAILLIGSAFGVAFKEVMEIIFFGVEHRDMIMPLFFASMTFFVYMIVFTADFISGIRASRHEARIKGEVNFINHDFLWRSFWKFFGVIIILFILTFFCLMTAAINTGVFRDMFYNIFLMAIPSVMLMVILFEFYSIGVNIKRRFGYKPSYYTFFEELSKAIEKGIIRRIGRWFGGEDNDDDNYRGGGRRRSNYRAEE